VAKPKPPLLLLPLRRLLPLLPRRPLPPRLLPPPQKPRKLLTLLLRLLALLLRPLVLLLRPLVLLPLLLPRPPQPLLLPRPLLPLRPLLRRRSKSSEAFGHEKASLRAGFFCFRSTETP
jgi:hypothetical protein